MDKSPTLKTSLKYEKKSFIIFLSNSENKMWVVSCLCNLKFWSKQLHFYYRWSRSCESYTILFTQKMQMTVMSENTALIWMKSKLYSPVPADPAHPKSVRPIWPGCVCSCFVLFCMENPSDERLAKNQDTFIQTLFMYLWPRLWE